MADPAPDLARRPLSDVVRERIRMRAFVATHQELAERMTAVGQRVFGPDYRVSRSKVSEVIRGRGRDSKPRLDDVPIWAEALETTEAFLLGQTTDWQPTGPRAAILSGATRAMFKGWDPPPGARQASLIDQLAA